MRSPQHKFAVKLHCEHDDSLLGLLVACILCFKVVVGASELCITNVMLELQF